MKVESIVIDLDKTVLIYEYGDEFVYPILKTTLSNGMTYGEVVEEKDINQMPNINLYGVQTVTLSKCDEKGVPLSYEIYVAQKVVESTAEQLKIQNRTTVAGGNVIVQFSFANMPDIKSIMLCNFVYDNMSLEIVEGRWKVKGEIAHWDKTSEIATFTYAENTQSNTYIFELELKAANNCLPGNYAISCDAIVNASNENGVDYSVELVVAPGSVSIIDVARGDFNGDNKVDDEDVVYLLRSTLFSDMFVLNQIGDMNGDDIVNSDDAIYLLRYTLLPEENPLYW